MDFWLLNSMIEKDVGKELCGVEPFFKNIITEVCCTSFLVFPFQAVLNILIY